MIRNYCYCVYSSAQLYLSKDSNDDLQLFQTFIETKTPLYNYLGHKFRLNISEVWLSTFNRSYRGNRTYQRQIRPTRT